MRDLYNSTHIRGKDVYVWEGSLASGNPLTSVVNSIYNQISFRYAWYRLQGLSCFTDEDVEDGTADIRLLNKFDDAVYLCVYGDDNVLSVREEHRDTFNPGRIAETVKDIGLTLTHSSKAEEANMGFGPIEDLDFLKRSFVKSSYTGKWIGPLELASIEKSICWLRRGQSELNGLLENVRGIEDELCLHGIKSYNDNMSKMIVQIQREYNHTYPFRDWKAVVDDIDC